MLGSLRYVLSTCFWYSISSDFIEHIEWLSKLTLLKCREWFFSSSFGGLGTFRCGDTVVAAVGQLSKQSFDDVGSSWNGGDTSRPKRSSAKTNLAWLSTPKVS